MRASCTAARALLFGGFALLTSCAQQPAPPPAPPRPPVEYLGEWGTRGDGPGQLKRPAAIAADDLGNAYISDAGSGFVHKFDPKGRPLLSFQDERMKAPGSIAIDRGGAIYVFDDVRRSIFIFLPDGTRFREIRGRTRLSRSGSCSIAVDSEGSIFVLDAPAFRVLKLDARGRLLKSWGKRGSGPGEFVHPAGISVDPDGIVYIGNSFGARIMRFTSDGEFLGTWGESKLAEGWSPALMASPKGVFLMDGAANTLEVWTLDGRLKCTHELGEPQQARFAPPPPPRAPPSVLYGAAWVPPDRLLVLDIGNPRVLRFRINF